MSRTGKTLVYNHVWNQQNQAKIPHQSGKWQEIFMVCGFMKQNVLVVKISLMFLIINCTSVFDRQEVSIGLCYGLTPNKWLAITWTDDYTAHWDIYASPGLTERSVAQIPQYTSPISHNAPFCNRNVHMCAHFCYKIVHCGISVSCIVGFMRFSPD